MAAKGPPDTTATARRLVKVAAWLAWGNSLLCSLQIFVLMLKIDLESVVMNPIVLTSSSSAEERAFAAVCYVCIALATLQTLFAVLAWIAKQRSVSERLYYSFATAAATGYLLLLNHWCLIPAL